MVRTSPVQVALTIHTLRTGLSSTPAASGTDGFINGCAMCYHVYVIMYAKDPYLSLVTVGLAGLSLHV